MPTYFDVSGSITITTKMFVDCSFFHCQIFLNSNSYGPTCLISVHNNYQRLRTLLGKPHSYINMDWVFHG